MERGKRFPGGARIAALAGILFATAAVAPGDPVTLAGRADGAAIARTKAEAARRGWRNVTIAAAQSFAVRRGDRQVATLLSGAAMLAPDVPGCFVAMVGARVALVPTIGTGAYETTGCVRPEAAGILSTGDPVRIGMIFTAFSPNAVGREPIVLNWHPSSGALSIDATLSTRASLAGAQSIAAMRRAVR